MEASLVLNILRINVYLQASIVNQFPLPEVGCQMPFAS